LRPHEPPGIIEIVELPIRIADVGVRSRSAADSVNGIIGAAEGDALLIAALIEIGPGEEIGRLICAGSKASAFSHQPMAGLNSPCRY
jgi:hypothetical protein